MVGTRERPIGNIIPHLENTQVCLGQNSPVDKYSIPLTGNLDTVVDILVQPLFLPGAENFCFIICCFLLFLVRVPLIKLVFAFSRHGRINKNVLLTLQF